MPFQREAYRSDLSGTIADLMGRGTANQAELIRANAAIQARAAEQRGQNTAQLFGTIGQLAQGTIHQIQQDRIDAPKRELDRLQLEDAHLKIDDAKRTAAEDRALRDLFARGQETRPEEIYQVVGPKRGAEILKGFSSLRSEQFKEANEVRQAIGQAMGGVLALPETMRGEAYGAVRTNMLGRGVHSSELPEAYSPEAVQQFVAAAMTPDKQYDVANPKPVAVAPNYSLVDTRNPQAGPIYTAPPAPKEPTKPQSAQEYEYAKANGYTGTYAQYQTEDANRRRPVVNVSTQPAAGDFDLTGDAFLATIPKEWRNTVRKIANYEEDPTKSVGMRSGMRDKVVQWVNQVNPGYKADEFAVRGPTRKAFTTGVQGQQINAINTAIGHIDQLTGLADKLQNGGFVPGNAAFNAVRTMFGGESVTNFDTLKDALAGEVSSVLAKGGATVSGIAEAKEKIHGSNSPAQLAGYVKTLIPIMGSKLASLDYQYHQAMGADDSYSALSPESRMILSKHGFDPAQHDGRDRSTKGDPMGIR